MKAETKWICPACQAQVPVEVDVNPAFGSLNQITIAVPETALADVFAHAWTHRQETPA